MPSKLSPLLIATVTSVDERSRVIFLSPRNAARLFEDKKSIESVAISEDEYGDRAITPAPDIPQPTTLMLSLERNLLPKDLTAGFVFGKGADADILLAAEETAMSRQHFAIQVRVQVTNATPRYDYSLALVNMSRWGTEFASPAKPSGQVLQDEPLILSSSGRIQVGSVSLDLWISPGPTEERYQQEIQDVLRMWSKKPKRMGIISISGASLATARPTDVHAISLNIRRDEMIGSGANADVYKARDESRRAYAVKVFRRESDRVTVEQQLELARKLIHPHIVKIYRHLHLTEQSVYYQRPYLVMELAPHSLKGRLPLISPEQIGPIFTQLFSAVGFMHSHGCTHRDLKPENVLVRGWAPLHVLVADFDYVNWNTPLKLLCGTLRYAAPDLVESHLEKNPELGFYTSKVDVWSLGVMLLEACIEDGLEDLRPQPRQSQGTMHLSIKEWTNTIRSFLVRPKGLRSNFDAFFTVSVRMLNPQPTDRAEMRIANAWLEDAIESQRDSPIVQNSAGLLERSEFRDSSEEDAEFRDSSEEDEEAEQDKE